MGSRATTIGKAEIDAVTDAIVQGQLERKTPREVARAAIAALDSVRSQWQGCGRPLAPGQFGSYCGEPDADQTTPVLCRECGGTLKLAE